MSQLRPGESPGHTPGAEGSAEEREVTPGAGIPDGLAGSTWTSRLPSWAPIAILFGIGFLVHFPAVTTLFFLDDVIHRSLVEGYFPGGRSPLDLYSFVDDHNRAELFERGLLPWWTHPELSVRFFRPLSSALVWLDHTLLGGHPLPMHLHSLAWWAIAVLAVRRLYQTSLSPRVTWIATLIFATSPCHALPLSWIANRDALLSLAFGTLGLVSYVSWRKDGRARDCGLALLSFSVALAAGEYALSFLAYVGAFELVRKRGPLVVRVLSSWPYVIPAAIYLGVRSHLGYGTARSGFYADPFSDPGIFLWHAPRRFATLILDGWLAIAGDVITWELPTWILTTGVLFVVATVLFGLRESFATLDAGARETTSWLLVGSVFALVPVLAVVPAPRVLGASMIGLGATVAVIVDGAWFRPTPMRAGVSRELAVLAALFLGFCQLVRGPGEAWLQGRHYRGGSYRFAEQIETFAEMSSTGDELIVARGLVGAFFIPFAIGPEGLPRRHRLLAETSHVLALRVDERTIDLYSARDGSLFVAGEGCLFRDLRHPFAEGDVIETAGLRTTIRRVDDGRVTAARFQLDEPLETYRFLNETRYAFEEAAVPPIGMGAPFDAGPRPDD